MKLTARIKTPTKLTAKFNELKMPLSGGFEEGYERGYAAGYSEGETAGYAKGEAHGRTEGYTQGKTDGLAEGYADGYAKGYADGYAVGYKAGFAAGRVPVVEKDVNFYDHDGTLLYSYTLEEAQALTELPPLPKQPRLICQGWNWSLEKLKEQGYADVGAIYITDDGKTRVIVEITDLAAPVVYLNWIGATVNLDWGDGSAVETNVAAGNHQHEYASIGEYEIDIEVVSGTLNPTYNKTELAFVGDGRVGERNKLKRLYLGNKVASSMAWLGFVNCYGLETITIPEGVRGTGGSTFSGCRSLKHISYPKSFVSIAASEIQYGYRLRSVSLPENLESIDTGAFKNTNALYVFRIPNSVASLGNSMFSSSGVKRVSLPSFYNSIPNTFFDGCNLLESVEISNSVTHIGNYAIRSCSVLTSLEIPSAVETIGTAAFYGCGSLKKIKFISATPPVVANANAFEGIPTDCVVEVPVGTLDEYQNATNYGSIAAQMVEVEV